MLRRILRRVRAILRPAVLERELDDELRYHLDREAAGFVRDGLTPDEAEAAALGAFGRLEPSREACRDARGVRLATDFGRDLRFAARMVRRNPGLSTVVVLTVAVAIGANTALFSLVNGVLLTPLDFPASERLVVIAERTPERPELAVAFPDFLDWRARQHAFDDMAASLVTGGILTGGGEPERVFGRSVTRSFFSTLGVTFHLGRPFSAAEDRPGGTPAMILNYGLWQRRYAADATIIGRSVTYNGLPYAVVGVMAPGFDYYGRSNANNDFFLPLGQFADEHYMQARDMRPLQVMARLKPGVSLERAQADLGAVAAGLAVEHPATNRDVGVRLRLLLDDYVGDSRLTLVVLLGASGLVLAVACANIANLLLARATVRRREIGVRLALGAGRVRIVRQLLVESLMLSVFGGAIGLAFGAWATRSLVHQMPAILPRLADVAIDGRVVAVAVAVTMLTGMTFGGAPALQSASIDVQQLLRDGGRSIAGSGRRVREALVVCEVALSVALLVGAGLLVRSVSVLAAVDPGYRADHVVTMRLRLPDARYRDREQVVPFLHQALERISAIPEVAAACLTTGVPFGRATVERFDVETVIDRSRDRLPLALTQWVTSTYHATFGISLVAGRYFSPADDERAAPVAIVDQELARRHFPGRSSGDVVGRTITLVGQPGEGARRIVGVVAHVRHAELAEPPRPEIYVPYDQTEPGWQVEIGRAMDIAVKTQLGTNEVVSAIRKEVRAMDAELPLSHIRSLSEALDDSMAPRVFNVRLLGGFALTALLLSVLGVYGMMSYSVTQRSQELGVRIALGASRAQVVGLVMRRGLVVISIGLVAGLAAALAGGRVLGTLLYAVTPADPVTFGVVALALVVVAASATYIPARRASRSDPLAALRDS
jgi:putative ABC transport system permease protein